jgi:glycosyltransferase involved in cell wall biosynthesis
MPSSTVSLGPGATPGAVYVSAEHQCARTATRRVLHVINGEHYSGAERVQDLLAQRLPELGFEVGFACVKPGDFPKKRSAQDAKLFEMPMRNRFDVRVARQLAGRIEQERFELVHAHTPRSVLIGSLAAARAGVPLVYHVHSPASQDSTRTLINWLNSATEKWSIRKASRLIAVSPSLVDHMVRAGVPAEQIKCVPNGVPGVPFDEQRQAPRGQWTLGTVALFRPRKGLETLLEALASLRGPMNLNVKLRAVGPFETKLYEKEVRRRAEDLGLGDAIEWTGFVRDVQEQFATIDVFVLPSLFGEGLPMVVLESLAAGVPIVATKVEGIPYAIRDGVEGVLVRPGDAHELAAGIQRIVAGELDWMTLRKQAYIRHAENFSDRAMAQGVAEVYRQVLAAN